jgi:hypothetical protein
MPIFSHFDGKFDQIWTYLTKFGHIRTNSTKLDEIRRSNSNLKTKFDLEFEIRIRHF